MISNNYMTYMSSQDLLHIFINTIFSHPERINIIIKLDIYFLTQYKKEIIFIDKKKQKHILKNKKPTQKIM